jgi:hypothetical protein
MDPWRPKYKYKVDALETVKNAAIIAAYIVTFMAIVILSL